MRMFLVTLVAFAACGNSSNSQTCGQMSGCPACVTSTVCANSTKDCGAGQRCNTSLNPPVCQALYCGAAGTACAGDSANDLCASRMCAGGVCAAPVDMAVPANSCCVSGHPGNELGVGKYCTTSDDCAGQKARTCSTIATKQSSGICTFVCSLDDCGTNATCVTNGAPGGICLPTDCNASSCT